MPGAECAHMQLQSSPDAPRQASASFYRVCSACKLSKGWPLSDWVWQDYSIAV